MSRRLVVVGDTLLDRDLVGLVRRVSPEAPVPVLDSPNETARPGGAGLAAAFAARDGFDVTLVTALASDEPAATLRDLLDGAGVELVDVGMDGETPQKVRVRSGGQSLLRLDYCSPPGRLGAPPRDLIELVRASDAVLVSDYGRGLTAAPQVRELIAGAVERTPVVWDPHPRGAAPVPGALLATPNRDEAAAASGVDGSTLRDVARAARTLLGVWRARSVAITMADAGALLATADGAPLVVPAVPSLARDTCGAGDRFAAAAATRLAQGALPSEAVCDAVMIASRFVDAGGVASWNGAGAEALDPAPVLGAADVVARTRARGGIVVATGGCFDVLHAGHVGMLQAARRLGDCLVVCLNSDASVRKLKGPDRPVMSQEDRVAILLGIGAVDAVVVFDEPTPERVLEEIRPEVFAKGADYALTDLPEGRVLERWGGQVVLLPYLQGRSTTALLKEVDARDGE